MDGQTGTYLTPSTYCSGWVGAWSRCFVHDMVHACHCKYLDVGRVCVCSGSIFCVANLHLVLTEGINSCLTHSVGNTVLKAGNLAERWWTVKEEKGR